MRTLEFLIFGILGISIKDKTQTSTYQFRSLSVLEDGTWNIPGVGIIIISAGVIMLGNKAIETDTYADGLVKYISTAWVE